MRLELSLLGGFILRQAQDEESRKYAPFNLPHAEERPTGRVSKQERAAPAAPDFPRLLRKRELRSLADASLRDGHFGPPQDEGVQSPTAPHPELVEGRGALGALALLAGLLAAGPAHAYPLYGSEDTGIKRLEQARLAHEGKLEGGRKKVSGELLSVEQVDLRLLGHKELDLPSPDPAFTAEIRALLGENTGRYGISVLDLTDLGKIRYAEHNGGLVQNPGSVGKIAVATGLFQTLADLYPNDEAKRRAVLHDTVVTANEFIVTDSHTVRFWNPEARMLTRRPLKLGDQGSLWEYLDWMLSASSNAAAAMVQREAILLKHFGAGYPPAEAAIAPFFKETPKQELANLLTATLQDPLTRSGIDLNGLRQGSLFTRTGKARVPGTSSHGTARELMNYLLRLEQGRIVDPFSSREIKRLIYMTERRIRYASSPALRDAAVYFKSGSLYSCQAEEGFSCKKYHGNVKNYMNSIAIVEAPAQNPRLYYIVTLMSNVLRKNSAVDHQTLATRIHRLIEKAHGVGQGQ